MALNDFDQIKKTIEESKYILILFNGKNNGESAASALALKTVLEKMKKQADIVGAGYTVPASLGFLPNAKSINSDIIQVQKFIIKVDVSHSPIDTISYDVRDNQLSIYLTPKSGIISKNELRTAQSTFKYDLIITLGTSDLDSLGSVFINNTDLFYKTTIINIDYHPNNERYGQMDLIDLTCSSTAEVVYKTIKKTYPDLIDSEIATALLTGMSIATKSFRSFNTTPFTLQLASELITYGADREKVVHNLYRMRSMSTLKLWGQALTHLQNDPQFGLVWTTLTRDDFIRSGARQEDLSGIIDELISNSPEAKIIVLLYETDFNNIVAQVATEKNFDAIELLQPLVAEGTKKLARLNLKDKNLQEAENEILKVLKSKLK